MRGNIRQITLILKQYKMLKSELENTKMIYEEFSKREHLLRPVDTTREALSKSYVINSSTEDSALSLINYKESIAKLELQISVIDTALKCLTEKEREIIQEKYIENSKWYEVSCKVGLSEKWCKELKNQAYTKLIRVIPIEIYPNIFFN